jgi:predicted phosphodiesterase
MSLRRIGVIGDIHAEDDRLAAALAHLRALGAERILAVGDIVDRSGGDVDRCCALLASHDVLAVRGNHDRWIVANEMRMLSGAHLLADLEPSSREFLAALPKTRMLSTVAGDLLLCHAVGEDDMVRLHEDDEGYALTCNDALQAVLASGVPLMVCGHTHNPMVRAFAGLTVINAGTLQRDSAPCFLFADLERRTVQFFDVEDPRQIRESLRFAFGRAGQDVWGSGF